MDTKREREEKLVADFLRSEFMPPGTNDGIEVVLDSDTGRLVPVRKEDIHRDTSLRPVDSVTQEGYASPDRD